MIPSSHFDDAAPLANGKIWVALARCRNVSGSRRPPGDGRVGYRGPEKGREDGAAFTLPFSSSVVTYAIGRGTTRLESTK
jgi:hypothetical protein